MAKYILNSAVVTTPGYYYYRLVTIEEAREWLADGDWESTIGYPETAEAFETVFGVKPEVNRRQIYMGPGDQALIFRLTKRLEDIGKKGKVGVREILKYLEIGLLEKLA
ncbi:MAG: hypothetical protein DRP08_03285 [Candidatus Aenigmatarchaeota archaeon]|nr:MAG: hypothetical protein DRP08_03285 [Candidatus Aenigmarchaeota archaeon]